MRSFTSGEKSWGKGDGGGGILHPERRGREGDVGKVYDQNSICNSRWMDIYGRVSNRAI